MGSSRLGWKRWLRLSRLVPLVISLAGTGLGFTAVVTDRLDQEKILGLVLVLLGFLAFDALTERLTVLEKIEEHLGTVPPGQALQARSALPHPTQWVGSALSVDVAAISAISLTSSYYSFFEERLRDGCRLRFLLLDPESPALEVWRKVSKVDTTREDIETSLKYLAALKGVDAKRCEVRLAPTYLPFSLFVVDGERKRGQMVLEFHALRKPSDERPHLRLRKAESKTWFDDFREQFYVLWDEATEWNPAVEGHS